MKNQIIIRNYKKSELSEIISLTAKAYSTPYKSKEIVNSFHENLESLEKDIERGLRILVAEEKGELIGAVRFAMIDSKLKLGRLAVLSNHRCKGVGSKLINSVLKIAQERNIKIVILDVMEEKELVTFYEKFGFEVKSKKKHKNHYDVIMEKEIE